MKPTTATVLIALFGAAVSACDVEEQEPAPPPAAEEERAMDADAPPAGEAAMTLRVDSLEDGGEYITDGEGRALYAIEGEPEGQSTCYDECAEEWPPLLVTEGGPAQSGPTAGAAAVRGDFVGTLQRQDGNRQVSYAGRALYYYQDDVGPGQTEGHHVMDQWGEWYLVQPDGELLEDSNARATQ